MLGYCFIRSGLILAGIKLKMLTGGVKDEFRRKFRSLFASHMFDSVAMQSNGLKGIHVVGLLQSQLDINGCTFSISSRKHSCHFQVTLY
jgi:hypothetical protein